MSDNAELSANWRQTLCDAGADNLLSLLDHAALPGALKGTWTLLTKPGLGRRQRWRWMLKPGDGASVLYVKRYERPPWRMQWDRIWRQTARHSTAWWEFAQARRLAEANIPAAAAVGYAEHMRGCLERASLVLLERVPGEAFDRAWPIAERAGAPLTRGLARHDLVRRLARFVAAFHSTGSCHRDLYLCHIFVDWSTHEAAPPRFTLIDLARTHRPRLRRMRWLIKDLAQLDSSARVLRLSRTDRYRFLLAYLGLQSRAPRARRYVRRIVRKSDRILRRERRKRQSR